ncbi:MAG: molecular chaperone HtpG [Planctomycetota bacterium]
MSAETLQFKTELKQILHIIVHSLYSHKDIFLRELVSNASDAIDKVRFESLTNHDLIEGDSNWKIKLIPNKEAGTLTISDNGIGMTREELVENLGTVAKSGTKAFIEALKNADAKDRPDLIGQFGVGFYSSFMAADTVSVVSKAAGKPASKWTSNGEGEFTIEDAERAGRGTDITLHLKADSREFIEEWTLREVVKKYSDYVEHPITMDVQKTGEKEEDRQIVEETINSQKAIWLKRKSEVTAEEHTEFYKHLSHDFEAPAKTIQYSPEGIIEFKALLYIPAKRPMDFMWAEAKRGLSLYIRRVLIMDNCEKLLPPYLRFVKGVVDAAELPLNVSREILQDSPLLEKIKTNLTNKVLSTLDEMKNKEIDVYTGFYKELGVVLKEGISSDWGNREKIADLLLYESTKTEPGKLISLAKYVEGMTEGQEEIYYLIGESRELIEQSPHIEALKAQGREVLLMTEPIDEFGVEALGEYKGKKLKAADKGAPTVNVDEQKKEKYKSLLDVLKTRIADVKEVRLSTRLKDSAACLVADDGDMSSHMERLMKRMGRADAPESKRVLELNPDHPAIEALQSVFTKDATDARIETYGRILYDQALIAEGSKIKDSIAFAKRINELLAKDAKN